MRKKRIISGMMAAVMVAASVFTGTGFSAQAAGENTPPEQPTELKVEMLKEAYGLNTKDPALSWVVNDQDPNEMQTAYQIQVDKRLGDFGSEEDRLIDTGWVESKENTYVHLSDTVENAADLFSDNELYYWRVRTKDKAGAEGAWSEPTPFMTGIATEWQDTTGIWADPNANAEETLWTNYTATFDMKITAGNALAVLARTEQASKTGYMLQFRDKDNMIKVHKINSGNVNSTPFKEISLNDAGIKLPEGKEFGVKIHAKGSLLNIGIKTGDSEDYLEAGSIDISGQGNVLDGTIGFRTGRYEAGTIRNMNVTAEDGTILYESTFEKDDKMFSGCSVSNGNLMVGNSVFAVYGGDLTKAGFDWSNYTVEETLQTAGNVYTLFRFAEGKEAAYMYQVNPGENTMAFYTRASVSSPPEHVADIDLTDKVALNAEKPFKIKITAAGSTVNAWLDADAADDNNEWVLADENRDVSSFNYGAGYVGFRTDTDAEVVVSNVTITDKNGNVQYQSDFTEDNLFSDSFVRDENLIIPGNLKSCSIFSPGGSKLKNLGRYTFLRSPKLTFETGGKEIDKVIVSAACRGTGADRGIIYDLYMNGICLGAGSARELNNVSGFGYNSGYRQVYYNSYDVTELLGQNDANVISAVGNSRDEARSILVQATAFYTDGSKAVICNSGKDKDQWKTLDGTNAFADDGSSIGTGWVQVLHDNFNAKYYPYGWQNVDYDDSEWATTHKTFTIAENTTGTSGNVLYPFSAENALRFETREGTERIYENGTSLIVDLGKEIVGGLKVNLDSATAQTVTVRMGEELNSDGSVRHNMRALQGGAYEDKWSLAKGLNSFETVTMRNFRYIEFIGLDDETKAKMMENNDCINGWAIQQTFDEEASDFKATDNTEAATLMNRLYELSKYTIKATNQDLFVDSQARERGAYEGDLLVNSNTSYAMSGNYSLARHSNEWLIDNPTWPNDYSLFSVEMAYWDYIYTGNTDSISEQYEALQKKLTTRVKSVDDSGLIRLIAGGQASETALIDWPANERDGYQKSTFDVIINSEYVGIYNRMADICDALGKTSDAEEYRTKAGKVKDALIQYAFDEENGCFYDSLDENKNPTKHSSMHATAYALNYGVYADQNMADRMAEFVYGKCKEQFTGSVYVTYFILNGLYQSGNGDMAERLLTNPKTGAGVKTYANLLDNLNCTITPEAWGPTYKSNMTFSHPWGAAPGCAIVQGMFGILPTDAGFDAFTIKIQPGDLASAEVKTPTVKGSVLASYDTSINGTAIKAKVTIPVNTTAAVSVPTMGQEHNLLLVDGKLTTTEVKDGFLTVELGSGNHTLEVPSVGTVAMEIKGSDEINYVGDKASASFTYTDTEGNTTAAKESGAVSYASDNTSVAAVNQKTGAIVYKGEGSAVITATLKLENVSVAGQELGDITLTARQTVKVIAPDISDMYIDTEGTLTVGDKADVSFVNQYENGKKETDITQVITSDNPDVADIDDQGILTAKSEGTATLTAEIDRPINVSNDFAYDYQKTEDIYSDNFDNGDQTFGGLNVQDGAALVGKSSKVFYDNEDAKKWDNYVYSGKFKIDSNCGNLTFRVQDQDTFYLWQFRADNHTLKKHVFKKGFGTEGYLLLGEIQLSDTLKDSEFNDFEVILDGSRITTYLNGILVDITEEDTLANGSIGVRNGRTESCYMDDLAISSFKRVVIKKVTVEAAANVKEADTIINRMEDIDRTLYSQEDLEKADALAADLKALIQENPGTSSQEAINQKATELKNLLDALQELPADTENLNTILSNVQKIEKGKYTDDSFGKLEAAIKKTEDLLKEDPTISRQTEVDAQIQSLVEAVADLVVAETPVEYADLSELNDAIAKAEKVNPEGYTSESLDSMNNLLKAAKELAASKPEKSLESTVATVRDALNAAISGLKRSIADLSKANAALLQADKIDRSLYTSESLEKVGTAVKELESLISSKPEISEQDKIDSKADELTALVLELEELPADTANLEQMLGNAKKIKKADYTNASFAALTKEIEAAQQILDKNLTISKQNEVDSQIQKLIAAMSGLVKMEVPGEKQYADLTALNKEIEKAKAVRTDSYTEKSVNAMNTALAAAQELAASKPEKSLQSTVDTTTKALRAAVNGLSKIKVNKTVIRKAARKGKGKIRVTWKKNTTADGYYVQYSTSKNFKKSVKLKRINSAKATSTVIGKLKSRKVYYVRVRGYKKANGARILGAYSRAVKVKVK